MVASIFQRLWMIHLSDDRLHLRENPVLDWVVAGGLLTLGAMVAIMQFWWTVAIACVLAGILMLQARTREIVFDVTNNQLRVTFRSVLRQQIALEIGLSLINRAYLKSDDNGATQIILVNNVGDEMGLSAYSRDMRPWKEEIVIAINAILHSAHQMHQTEP